MPQQSMLNKPDSKDRKISLRLILVVPFVLQTFATVGLTGWLSLRNGQEAVKDVTTQLRSEITARISERLHSYLTTPEEVNKLNAKAIGLGQLNLQDLTSMERHFWHQSQVFDLVSYIQFASQEGEFVGLAVNDDESLTYQVTEFTESLRTYAIDSDGDRGELLKVSPNYDPRIRPWYTAPARANSRKWSEVYAWLNPPTLAITLGEPYYDTAGRFQGILAADVTLAQMSDFLRTLKVGKSGKTFIIERSGYLIASASVQEPFILGEQQPQRLLATEVSDSLIQGTARYLQDKFGDLDRIEHSWQLSFELQGGSLTGKQRQFLQVTPFQDGRGLDWLIVVVIPEADFMARINANTRTTIILCLGALTLATVLGIFTAGWITQPVLKLSRASVAIASGKLEQNVPSSPVKELGILAASFNQMSQQLQQSYEQLEEYSHSLEQKVDERTQQLQQEIKERQQVEAALRVSQERYQLTMESVNEGIWDWHVDTHEIYFSPQWKKMLGYQPDEIIDAFSSWEQLLHPDDRQPALEAVKAHLEGKTPVFHVEFRMRHQDGTYRWILSRAKVVERDEGGKPLRLLGSHTDISDRKLAEEEIKLAKQAADAANQAKSEFLANMSHELRTPLNGILGYAQILRRSQTLSFDDQKGISIIAQCGDHLLNLINDILDLSKIEARKMELYPKDLHLISFLTGVAEICRIKAEQKGIALRYLPSNYLPESVSADEKRLRQVLINLLGNAIKFTDTGSVTFKVEVMENVPQQTANIRFQVEDTGVGMTPEQIDKIFLPFEQVGASDRKAEGTGLGLAISKKIVQMMGSSLKVESQLGVGSIFSFEVELPLGEELTASAQTIAPEIITGFTGKQSVKIMVVDDRWENRSILVNLLEPLGFEVAEAGNGEEGLESAAQTSPDLIITDLAMPTMDGFEMIRRLRATPEFQNVPIVTSSASVFSTDQAESIAAGSNDFLAKPVQLRELLAKLKLHLGLEWVYETDVRASSSASQEASQEAKTIILPPPEELAAVKEAARLGDIEVVETEAHRLGKLDEKYVPFGERLLELAEEFDCKGIKNLLVNDGGDPSGRNGNGSRHER